MRFLVVLALVAVAAGGRPEYHDDVFHFSSLAGLDSLRGLSQTQGQTVIRKVQVAQPRQLTYQTLAQPVHIETHHIQEPVQVLRTLSAPTVTQVQTHHVQPVQVVKTVSVPAITQVHHVTQPVYTQVESRHHGQPNFRILKQVQEIDPLGAYLVDFETENGISAKEQSTHDVSASKQGSYSYTGPDGVQYTINWVADENGFRASGAHIPEIPAEIQRSLEINAANPAQYDEQGRPLQGRFLQK